MSTETLLGLVAAFCTTVSYLPQVVKAWRTGSTADLSMQMMLLLFSGLSLWVVYGFMKGDYVIVCANTVSLLLLANLIFLRGREWLAHREAGAGERRNAPSNWQSRKGPEASGLPSPG